MPRVSLWCDGALEDLLPRSRGNPLAVDAPEGATAGALIEDLGIPHTEVGSVSANGRPASLAYRLCDGDEIAAHAVREEPPRDAAPPRFVLDVHLGRLVRLLRLLGFDAAWSRDAADVDLAALAAREDRILLSRDRGLLKRREVRRGCLVRSQEPRRQLAQVADRYGLCACLVPFSRCLVCNSPLDPAGGSPAASARRPTGGCPSCGRRYWRGSHWQSLNAIVDELRASRRGRRA